jgi:hypothetical protein
VARAVEQHQRNRESLLANEGFAISMQQVVSGGLLLGALSQWADIVEAIEVVHLVALVFITGLALIAAVLAA